MHGKIICCFVAYLIPNKSRMSNICYFLYLLRAGEMIPEVEGARPWGAPRKKVPQCLKGPKTTYTTIEIAEKQSKRSKRVPPRKWNLWGPEGKVPPGPPPGFSGHVPAGSRNTYVSLNRAPFIIYRITCQFQQPQIQWRTRATTQQLGGAVLLKM